MSPAKKEAKDKADQPDRAVELRLHVIDSIAEVGKTEWDACANPNRNPNRSVEAEFRHLPRPAPLTKL